MTISLLLLLIFIAGVNIVPAAAADIRPGEIVTVLPKDAIPAIMSPKFQDAAKASWLRGSDKIVGVTYGEASRAYPIATLSRHEIVNDKLAGLPFAVTW